MCDSYISHERAHMDNEIVQYLVEGFVLVD